MAKMTGIISVVIFIVLLSLVVFLIPKTSQSGVSGSSVLSLQQVQYFQSTSECFNSGSQPLWLYTLRADGLSQSAYGTITPSEVDSSNIGKEAPTRDFTVDTAWTQQCVYPIVLNPSAENVFKASQPIEWTDLLGRCPYDTAVQKCGSGNMYYGKYGSSFTCFCFSVIQKTGGIGSFQNLNNPSINTQMDITVGNGLSTETKSFTTSGQIKGKIGDNVCAVWQGNTVTGDVCRLSDSDSLPIYYNGFWKLISQDKYATYKTSYDTFETALQGTSLSKSILTNYISDLNTKADSCINSAVTFGTISEPASLSNAKVIKTLDSLLQYPVLSLYIRADYVGIITPIPKPKILSATSSCFSSGSSSGLIEVNVKNEGTQRGSIDIYGTCTNGFNVERKSITLDAGKSSMVYLPITGTTNQNKLEGTCTITADSIDEKDTKVVSVCVSGLVSCTKGKKWCENSNVFTCFDGISQGISENCVSKNLVCDYKADGTPFCAPSRDYCLTHPNDAQCKGGACGAWLSIAGKTIIPDIFCLISNFFEKFKMVFSILSGLLSAILAFVLYTKFDKTFSIGSHPVVPWIVALIAGLAIGYIAYIYFWLAIIVIVIIVLARILIP